MVLLLAGVIQCIGAWQDSQTTDEGAHLAAGLSYWRTGDFRLNPEHPPLVKLLAALPLVPWQQLQPSADPMLWLTHDEWNIGRLVLYHQIPLSETQRVLWLARVPMIALWLTLGICLWWWADRRAGPWAGTIAATLYSFDPTFLGHGHLITTDIAAALGFLTTCWAAERLMKHPSWGRVFGLAVIFAFSQLAKFSLLILWPLVFGIFIFAILRKLGSMNWFWWRRTLGVTVLISLVTTWMVYGFQVQRINQDPRIDKLWVERDQLAESPDLLSMPPVIQFLVRTTAEGSSFRQHLEKFTQTPIPAYSYWRGFFSLASHDFWGHTAYLLGKQSFRGWWYYFPVALFVKMPAPTLLLSIMLIVTTFISWFGRDRSTQKRNIMTSANVWLVIPPVIYFLWSLNSHINIGVRHILLVLPFLYVGIAQSITQQRTWWFQKILILLVASLPLVALSAWPNTIGYFNFVAGGTSGGHRVLLDSNLDWNQDLWRLRDYLKEQNYPRASIALFGSVPVEIVHPHPENVPQDDQVARQGQPHQFIIISKGLLYSVDLPFTWLQKISPTKQIGSSINVYDLR